MYVGTSMMQCNMNEKCTKFKIENLKDIKDKKLHVLYKKNDIFMIFKNKNSFIKMTVNKTKYEDKKSKIKYHAIILYLLYFFALILESIFFALFALRPLKQALRLNEEFVKDMLHDFNTPLSALRINLKILKKKFGNDEALQRSEESIGNILSLQENLHYFISQSKLQNEQINLKQIAETRVQYFQSIFPKLHVGFTGKNSTIYANKDIIIRIIDNLISNACKYNKKDGKVNISLENNILIIQDTGIGIQNPSKIFNRHYKETSSGLGIGLHIVKKLCDELGIEIEVQSIVDTGSSFVLNFKYLVR